MTKPRWPDFSPGSEERTVLRGWHTELIGEAQRGPRAELRRARDPGEVVFLPAFHRFLRSLEAEGFKTGGKLGFKLAAVAGLAAHVDQVLSDRSLASQMARTENQAAVSEARFRRLLETDDLDELFQQLRRVILLLRKHVALGDLARSVMAWDSRYDRRRQWAYDYYKDLSKKEAAS